VYCRLSGKGQHPGERGASASCASSERPSIRAAERMGAKSSGLLFGQYPLGLIEHEEAGVGVVADEGIVAKDSPYGKLRTFGN